ncbi:hypothetical protein [Streptomyces sp. NPDC090022]|uniref:hypothetical protein n=1 Tax=Streptomyces sp. NPDC090022 TaxID=3365920 RepID=UPI003803A8E5
MPIDPFTALNAMLRAEVVRIAPAPKPAPAPAPEAPVPAGEGEPDPDTYEDRPVAAEAVSRSR